MEDIDRKVENIKGGMLWIVYVENDIEPANFKIKSDFGEKKTRRILEFMSKNYK
jgi:hypothetical protein